MSQIFKLIPRNLIPKIANAFGVDRQSRVFSPTSHVLALVFGQLTHALGLNDICDTLRNHCGLVSKIRDCVPPSRNGLSHANRNRDAGMAEKLFWEVKMLTVHRPLILNYFRAKKQFNSGIVEGLNRKINLTIRKSFGFRTLKIAKVCLYHQLGELPEPQFTHKFW